MQFDNFLSRRRFLQAGGAAGGLLLASGSGLGAEGPTNDPLAGLKLDWTARLRWGNVVNITQVKGETNDERLAAAQAALAAMGGGVIFFPPGNYRFAETIKLQSGVVLRGAEPGMVASAHNELYALPTKIEFPKYAFQAEGDGTPLDSAFKGIVLADPKAAENVAVVNLDIHFGHILMDDGGGEKPQPGGNRAVYGCILRNAATADPSIPNRKIGQKGWQRFTARHRAAIDVKAGANLVVANNRLPKSGEGNFTMTGYAIQDSKKQPTTVDGIVFDYDNRPGMYVNHYGIGGAGGMGPDGTPETHPHGFRKGIVIRDNYIYNTGRMGIGFCGDGVQCLNNVIRIAADVWRPTTTGAQLTSGAGTNDNRAIEMRGWRWVVDGNDFDVQRNWAYDKKYLLNDGEGLMHEDHVNSTILDSRLTNNRGNAYLSLYKTGGIDGLLISGNTICVQQGAAIYVNADRNSGRFPLKRVQIEGNTLSGGGILLSGHPAEGCIVKGNRNGQAAPVVIDLKAAAEVADNAGFEIKRS